MPAFFAKRVLSEGFDIALHAIYFAAIFLLKNFSLLLSKVALSCQAWTFFFTIYFECQRAPT